MLSVTPHLACNRILSADVVTVFPNNDIIMVVIMMIPKIFIELETNCTKKKNGNKTRKRMQPEFDWRAINASMTTQWCRCSRIKCTLWKSTKILHRVHNDYTEKKNITQSTKILYRVQKILHRVQEYNTEYKNITQSTKI